MVILELISALLLIIYIIVEKRHIVPIMYELTFVTISSNLVVISYFLNSFTSLVLSSIVFLMVVTKIIRVGRLVEKRRKQIRKILRKIQIDKVKEGCIDYIDENIVLFLTTGEREPNKLVTCMGDYDEIRRLSQYV